MTQIRSVDEIRLENTRKLLESSKLSRKDFAEKVGVDYGQLSHYIGKTPVKKIGDIVARRIENAFDLTSGYLDQDYNLVNLNNSPEFEDEYDFKAKLPPNAKYRPVIAWHVPEDLDPNVYVIVPRVDIKFSAGNGLKAEFEPNLKDQGMAFLWQWIQKKKLNPRKLFVIDVTGDSMEPNIRDGSVVTLDKSYNSLEQVKSGRVYAIRYGDELRVKRLFRRFDGALIIKSDNPNYNDEVVENDQLNHIAILGKYVAHTYDGEI